MNNLDFMLFQILRVSGEVTVIMPVTNNARRTSYVREDSEWTSAVQRDSGFM